MAPVTAADNPTVANVVAALVQLQVPPAAESVRVVELPKHTRFRPTIGATTGKESMEMATVADTVPQLLVTV